MGVAYEGEQSVGDVLDDAQAALSAIAADHVVGGLADMRTVMAETMDALDQFAADRRPVTGVPSGLTELDVLTRASRERTSSSSPLGRRWVRRASR